MCGLQAERPYLRFAKTILALLMIVVFVQSEHDSRWQLREALKTT